MGSKMATQVEQHGVLQEFIESINENCTPDDKTLQYLQKIGMDDGYHERCAELAEDKAQREDEWVDDMMQYERAGLDEDEKKNIPKLDETNNESYRYLRSIGCMWQYDNRRSFVLGRPYEDSMQSQ